MALLRFVAFTWIGRAIVGVIVIAVVGATVVAPRLTQGSPQAALRTATVTRGNVTQTVTVSGSVNASALVKAAFRPSGRLAEILVKVGDPVIAGQPLARLEPTDLQTAVKQAEANLLSAEAKYDATAAGASAEDLALARNSLESATLSYEQSQKNTSTDVTNSQQTLDKARRALEDAKANTSNDVSTALLSLTKVKTTYTTARTTFASLTTAVDTDLTTYVAGVADLRAQVRGALAYVGDPGLSDVQSALTSADQSLASAEISATSLRSTLNEYVRAVGGIVAAAKAFDVAIATSSETLTAAGQYQTAQTAFQLSTAALNSAIDLSAGQIAAAQGSVTTANNGLNTYYRRQNEKLDQARAAVAPLLPAFATQVQLGLAVKTKISQAGTSLATITEAVNGSIVNAQQAYAGAQTKAQATLQAAEDAVVSAKQALTTAQDKAGSTLASSEVALSNARVNYSKSTATPKSTDIAFALSSLQLAQIALDKAKTDLENATLRAPVAGVISTLTNQVGEAPTNPFAVIAVTGVLTLHGTIGESEVAKLKLGQVATLAVDAVASGTRLTGKITGLDPVGTLQQGVPVYGVDITIDRPDPAVRPGMSGTATVIIQSKQSVLTVPNTAIRTTAGRRTVQVLQDGAAVDAGELVFGISNDTVTEVVSGLEEGQTIVLPAPRTTTTTQTGPGGQQIRVGGAGQAVPPGVPFR